MPKCIREFCVCQIWVPTPNYVYIGIPKYENYSEVSLAPNPLDRDGEPYWFGALAAQSAPSSTVPAL